MLFYAVILEHDQPPYGHGIFEHVPDKAVGWLTDCNCLISSNHWMLYFWTDAQGQHCVQWRHPEDNPMKERQIQSLMTEPAQWAATPHEALAYYLSLTFMEQTALAFVIDWQRKEVQRQGREMIARLKAEYENKLVEATDD